VKFCHKGFGETCEKTNEQLPAFLNKVE